MKIITSLFTTLATFALPLALTFSAAPTVFAHNGEDHSEPATSTVSGQALAPRTEAKSDDVEMLAVYENNALTLYLADFKTNEPITGAEVEIESGSGKALAQAVGDGAYKAETPWLAEPGRHALIVTIQGEQVADLLETSLDIPAPEVSSARAGLMEIAPIGLIGSLGGVAAMGLVAFGLRRRKK